MHNAIRVYDNIMTDEDLCDNIIKDFHTKDAYHMRGETFGSTRKVSEAKKSTDMLFNRLSDNNRDNYLQYLYKCLDQYKEDLPQINSVNTWSIDEGFNVQWYKPGEGFIEWHSENMGMNITSIKRMAVFMTYLNDVTDEGGTEFAVYKQKINAVKGRTVIWPADWSYSHRGIPSLTQEKYIITGWISYNNVRGEFVL